MKLLSKPELKSKKNDEALRLREIDRTLAKEIKELNDFRTAKENEKKQILDEYIQFAEKIAGEKALLEQGFESSEERKGVALRSLSNLAQDADKKLKAAEAKESSALQLESDCKEKESQLTTELKKLADREAIVDARAEKVGTDALKLSENEANFEKRQKEHALALSDKMLSLERREKVLDKREEDLKDASHATASMMATLDNERIDFNDEMENGRKALEKERAREVKEIVETSYKKREADLKTREQGIDFTLKMIRDHEVSVENDEKSVKAGYVGLEKAVKSHEDEVKAKREEYGAREAELSRTEASQSVRAKELDIIVTGIAQKEGDLERREKKLKENTAKEADKALTRQRELDDIASTLKTRWEKSDKDAITRTKVLDDSESALNDRAETVRQKEILVDKKTIELERKSLEWDEAREAQELRLDKMEESVSDREDEAEEKLTEARLLKSATETESQKLVERTASEEKRLSEERRAIADSRKTLDRAWAELRNKQKQ